MRTGVSTRRAAHVEHSRFRRPVRRVLLTQDVLVRCPNREGLKQGGRLVFSHVNSELPWAARRVGRETSLISGSAGIQVPSSSPLHGSCGVTPVDLVHCPHRRLLACRQVPRASGSPEGQDPGTGTRHAHNTLCSWHSVTWPELAAGEAGTGSPAGKLHACQERRWVLGTTLSKQQMIYIPVSQ